MQFIEKTEKFLEKFPDFLRWILALPLAILVSTVIQVIIAVGNSLSYVGPEWILNTFCQVVNSWCSGYCFVLSGAIMAPKYKFITSIVFTILFTSTSSIIMTYALTVGTYKGKLLLDIFLIILSIAASITACIETHKALTELDITK